MVTSENGTFFSRLNSSRVEIEGLKTSISTS
jgi:hypothetical protein